MKRMTKYRIFPLLIISVIALYFKSHSNNSPDLIVTQKTKGNATAGSGKEDPMNVKSQKMLLAANDPELYAYMGGETIDRLDAIVNTEILNLLIEKERKTTDIDFLFVWAECHYHPSGFVLYASDVKYMQYLDVDPHDVLHDSELLIIQCGPSYQDLAENARNAFMRKASKTRKNNLVQDGIRIGMPISTNPRFMYCAIKVSENEYEILFLAQYPDFEPVADAANGEDEHIEIIKRNALAKLLGYQGQ